MTKNDCPAHTTRRCGRSSFRSRLSAISAFALTCGLLASAPSTQAAEYAFTSYPLGVLAFGAGITPPPGTYVTNAVSFYSGNIGGNFDFGGRRFDAGVKADIFLDSTNILLVPQGKLLDGYFGASVTVPAGYVKYDASLSVAGAQSPLKPQAVAGAI